MAAVSIIMPVYNGETYLVNSLESILTQTFKDIEFIIINDGSTDNTERILRTYAAKDARIKIINQRNQGVTTSLNNGIALASSDYIARMDADDISLPTRIQKQYDFMTQHPSCVVVGSDYEVIDSTSYRVSIVRQPYKKDELKNILFLRPPFAHGSTMIRRATLTKLGGYSKESGSAEDYDLWMRLAHEGDFGYIPQHLYSWRISPNSITSTKAHEVEHYAQQIKSIIWSERSPKIYNSIEIKELRHTYNNTQFTTFLNDLAQLSFQRLKYKKVIDAFRQILHIFSVGKLGHTAIYRRLMLILFKGKVKV